MDDNTPLTGQIDLDGEEYTIDHRPTLEEVRASLTREQLERIQAAIEQAISNPRPVPEPPEHMRGAFYIRGFSSANEAYYFYDAADVNYHLKKAGKPAVTPAELESFLCGDGWTWPPESARAIDIENAIEAAAQEQITAPRLENAAQPPAPGKLSMPMDNVSRQVATGRLENGKTAQVRVKTRPTIYTAVMINYLEIIESGAAKLLGKTTGFDFMVLSVICSELEAAIAAGFDRPPLIITVTKLTKDIFQTKNPSQQQKDRVFRALQRLIRTNIQINNRAAAAAMKQKSFATIEQRMLPGALVDETTFIDGQRVNAYLALEGTPPLYAYAKTVGQIRSYAIDLLQSIRSLTDRKAHLFYACLSKANQINKMRTARDRGKDWNKATVTELLTAANETPNKKNPRRDIDDLTELFKALKSHGEIGRMAYDEATKTFTIAPKRQ